MKKRILAVFVIGLLVVLSLSFMLPASSSACWLGDLLTPNPALINTFANIAAQNFAIGSQIAMKNMAIQAEINNRNAEQWAKNMAIWQENAAKMAAQVTIPPIPTLPPVNIEIKSDVQTSNGGSSGGSIEPPTTSTGSPKDSVAGVNNGTITYQQPSDPKSGTMKAPDINSSYMPSINIVP